MSQYYKDNKVSRSNWEKVELSEKTTDLCGKRCTGWNRTVQVFCRKNGNEFDFQQRY